MNSCGWAAEYALVCCISQGSGGVELSFVRPVFVSRKNRVCICEHAPIFTSFRQDANIHAYSISYADLDETLTRH